MMTKEVSRTETEISSGENGMAGKRLTKQQMREDQFRDALEEIIFGFLENIEKHTKGYLIGLVVAVLLIGGTLGFMRVRASRLEEGSFLLSKVMDAYSTPVGEAGKNAGAKGDNFKSETLKDKAIEQRISALKGVSGAGSSVKYAAFYQAMLKAKEGKLDEAVKLLSPLTRDRNIASLALSARARLYEASGKLKEAEKDWSTLAKGGYPGMPPGEGWWLLGSFYERTGQDQKAVDAYSKIEAPEKSEKPVRPGGAQSLSERAAQRVKALKGEV